MVSYICQNLRKNRPSDAILRLGINTGRKNAMRDDNNRSFLLLIDNGLDMLLNLAAFIAGYYLTFVLNDFYAPVLLNSTRTMLFLFIGIIISSFVNQLFVISKKGSYIDKNSQISSIFLGNLTYFGLTAILTIIFADKSKLNFLLIWIILSACVSGILLVIKKYLILYILHLGRKHYGLVSKVVIVGDNIEAVKAFVKEITKDTSGNIMLIGAVGRKMDKQVGCEKLGDIEDFEEVLFKYRPDYVVFAFDSYGKEGTIKLVNLCDDNCVKTYFLPACYGFFKSSRQVEHIGALPLINVHSTPLDNPINAFIKRVIDIVGSFVLIILTSPIMIVAAIGVKLSSPGPVFFKQVRVGRMGKQFHMLKFRSMRVNDSHTTAWSTGVDDRKTKFGNFIRRTSIDELPQFFNVLVGSMSLVGPRPEIPHFVEYFKDKIPLYMVKHYVKPGITGLAQIKGLRGDTSIDDRIHEDINYIENWSLGLDIEILLKTPFKAVNKSEVYGGADEKGDEETNEQGGNDRDAEE